jgi:uncharacterized membrane protein YtjA (UPF0391 family)
MASELHVLDAEVRMLLLVVICLLLWFTGLMTAYTLGGLLHILLIVAIVLFLVHIIQGSSIGNA